MCHALAQIPTCTETAASDTWGWLKKVELGEWTAVIDQVVKCHAAVCCTDKNNVVTCATAQ